MPSTLVASITALLLAYAFLRMLLHFTQSNQEPPPIDTSIPFISPIIRMGRMGVKYWMEERDLPIYTIRLPATRLYIVNSTSLIPVVQRHVRTLSFSPILARIASNLINASKPGVEILSQDGEHGFIAKFHSFNQVNLSPGPNLDPLNRKIWETVASLRHPQYIDAPRKVYMYGWISHEIMMATTDGIYGHQNPFRNPEVRESWREYQSGITRLLARFVPSITAKGPVNARKVVVQAYEQYYDGNSLEDIETSAFTKKKHSFFTQNGLSDRDIAKTETAFTIAFLSNTIPATFWLLYHIFSDYDLLQNCRQELAAVSQKGENGICSLDLTLVKKSCPVLTSTYQETLRFHTMGLSVRQVVEDQLIDEQYLLKKGALVLIPASIQHNDPSVWGADAHEFNYRRFIRKDGKKRSWNPVAVRWFGGGLTLCPGRHLATSTILGFAASIIMNFDVQPTIGQWPKPTVKNSSLSISINRPDRDFEIELRSRRGQEWKATLSGSEQSLGESATDEVV